MELTRAETKKGVGEDNLRFSKDSISFLLLTRGKKFCANTRLLSAGVDWEKFHFIFFKWLGEICIYGEIEIRQKILHFLPFTEK